MKLDDFWALIHRSSTAANSQRERTEWLTGHLARLPVPAIIEFELHLTAQRKRVDARLMWGAAWIIMRGWCSGDGFFYFQPWLVGLGRDTFERVAGNPGSLADTPQIRRLAGRPRGLVRRQMARMGTPQLRRTQRLRTCHRPRRRT